MAERIIVALEGMNVRQDAIRPIADGDRLGDERDHLRTVIDKRADALELRGPLRAVGRTPFGMDEIVEFRHRDDVFSGKAGNARFPPRRHHSGIGVCRPEEWAGLKLAGDEHLVDKHAFIDDVEFGRDAGFGDVLLDDLGNALNCLAGLHDHCKRKPAGSWPRVPWPWPRRARWSAHSRP